MSRLLDLIKRHEGFHELPTWDKTGQEMWQGLQHAILPDTRQPLKENLGHLTIGYGFNLEAGMSEELAERILDWQVCKAIDAALDYPWFHALGDGGYAETPRQAVIVSMIHQLGPEGFKDVLCGHQSVTDAVMAWLSDSAETSRFPSLLRPLPGNNDSTVAQELAEMMRSGEWQA